MAPSKRGKTTKSRRAQKPGEGPLGEYRRKRDFERTREPAGSPKAARRSGLRFVIQKHAASHLHYDLRLEVGGVMRSWAVPKGPSLDPSVKRLAMQVEDHPIEYNTFEGTIPQGEYGGGTVMLWDRGTYRPDEPKKGEAPESAVRRGLESGKLSFTFEGERLHGSFALVRTERGEKPKWLLIKHRDDQAASGSDITEEVRTSVASGRTLDEIAAEGDRVWRSNRNGAKGGEERVAREDSTEGMIAPMRPRPARSLPAAGEWTFEPWRGGERVLAYVTPETAQLVDERARDVTRQHAAIAHELASLSARAKRPFVLDGEIAGDEFHAADILLDGDAILMAHSWEERRQALETLFRRRRLKQLALQEIDRDAETVLERIASGGWPGLLARRLDAAYEPGAQSDALLRISVH